MTEENIGRYIVIEGTDGAGTTTQKELLKIDLEKAGRQAIDVAEPGGTPIGEALRLIIKNGSLDRDPQTNLDLFTVCRRELARQVIRPAITTGSDVVSDRNWFSTIAYQGFGEGLSTDLITTRMEEALGELLIPSVAVIIDVPVGVSEERMKLRGINTNDAFERKGSEFFERVRNGYLWVAAKYGLPVIDGTQSIEAVRSSISELLQ